jgi:2-phosphosulfolactate phosphatase
VLPLAWREPAAVPEGAVLAGRRGSSSWSLSPSSLFDIPAGTRLALPSPNGATLSVSAATHGATVLAACLRNASAVATAALACRADGAIGVVPAGERWPGDGLRPAIEDLLGAGAVVAALARHGVGPCSPEALAAADAFEAALRRGLADALVACSSGRELAVGGFGADVALAAERDVSGAAPVLDNGESGLCYGAFSAGAR